MPSFYKDGFVSFFSIYVNFICFPLHWLGTPGKYRIEAAKTDIITLFLILGRMYLVVSMEYSASSWYFC